MLTDSWRIFAIGACIIALAYAFVWPRPRNGAHAERRPRLLHFTLRWAHSLVWWILALVFFLKSGAVSISEWITGGLAWSALAFYIVFLAALFYDRKKFSN